MRDDVFQELESALGRQCTECIQFYVNQIPSYLSDVSRDEQEQQRRVEKILSSQCREAIRKIPAANLAALATNISGTEALLSSRCPKAIEEIPDANIATFATNDRGIKYLLASHNSKVIKKIPTAKLTALAASGPAGVESIIASQCSDPMERVPSEILYQYLFDPNISEEEKNRRKNKIEKSRMLKRTKQKLLRVTNHQFHQYLPLLKRAEKPLPERQPVQLLAQPDSTTEALTPSRCFPLNYDQTLDTKIKRINKMATHLICNNNVLSSYLYAALSLPNTAHRPGVPLSLHQYQHRYQTMLYQPLVQPQFSQKMRPSIPHTSYEDHLLSPSTSQSTKPGACFNHIPLSSNTSSFFVNSEHYPSLPKKQKTLPQEKFQYDERGAMDLSMTRPNF